jgi:hypothetical protein
MSASTQFKSMAVMLLILLTCSAYSQKKDSVYNSQKIYKVTKNDGTVFLGRILSQDAREVLVDTREIGQVLIPKHEIKEIAGLKEGEMNEKGEFMPAEVFSTRYFITTNGLPIEKGESYIQWNLFGPDFQFAVAKNFGLGLMTSWLAVPIIGTAKYSIKIDDRTSLGIGGLVGTGSWALPQFAMALPFACLTFGDRVKNLTISGGYGALFLDHRQTGRALFSVAGMIKVGRKVSLVFDSFIMPAMGYRNVTHGAVDESTQLYYQYTTQERNPPFMMLIPGIRWQMESNKAFQFGFLGLAANGSLIPVPIPMVQWYRKL